jgi:hypothetical protein
LIILIFGKAYNLCSSLLCNLLQPPDSSSHFQIFSATRSSQTLSIYSIPTA